MRQDADAMAEIGRLARAGRLEVALGWTLPLEEAARAHALAEDSSIGGKVVLTPY
jgi:NADPH:quinone reductase-like Zn-dependent oxidoreductase